MAERTLTAMQTDRSVIVQQMSEGAVLAPGAGRILSVPVPNGPVVLPGETIATLAEDQYILRLQLPERHAQFMRAGDVVLIGAQGHATDAAGKMREGKVRLVYPEIEAAASSPTSRCRAWAITSSASGRGSMSTRERVDDHRAVVLRLSPGRRELRPARRRRRDRRPTR